MQRKGLTVRLPVELHERFYRCFPETGERSRIIERIIRRLVERQELVWAEESTFLDELLKTLGL